MSDVTANMGSPMVKPHSATGTMHAMIGEFGWIWIATLILFAVSAVVAPGTVRLGSLLAMLPFASLLAIVAVGQTVIIQQRGLDMSVVALVALGGVMAARLGDVTGSVALATLIAVVVAGLLGTVNGLLVARLNVMPIVATLASNAVFQGLVRTVSGNKVGITPPALKSFATSQTLGLPSTLILAILFISAVTVTIRFTSVGRRFVIVGAAPRTARAAGINVVAYQVGSYAFASICFAVAGILLAGVIGSASHLAGPDYLLPGIAAVVVGGTAFTGGTGSVVASGVAALFMQQLAQLVLAMGAGTAGQLLVQALAIVVATTIRHLPDVLRMLHAISRE